MCLCVTTFWVRRKDDSMCTGEDEAEGCGYLRVPKTFTTPLSQQTHTFHLGSLPPQPSSCTLNSMSIIDWPLHKMLRRENVHYWTFLHNCTLGWRLPILKMPRHSHYYLRPIIETKKCKTVAAVQCYAMQRKAETLYHFKTLTLEPAVQTHPRALHSCYFTAIRCRVCSAEVLFQSNKALQCRGAEVLFHSNKVQSLQCRGALQRCYFRAIGPAHYTLQRCYFRAIRRPAANVQICPAL